MVGSKPKFAQITGGKLIFSQITGAKISMKIQNPKNIFYKDEYKKKLEGGKPKIVYITGGKTLLTL